MLITNYNSTILTELSAIAKFVANHNSLKSTFHSSLATISQAASPLGGKLSPDCALQKLSRSVKAIIEVADHLAQDSANIDGLRPLIQRISCLAGLVLMRTEADYGDQLYSKALISRPELPSFAYLAYSADRAIVTHGEADPEQGYRQLVRQCWNNVQQQLQRHYRALTHARIQDLRAEEAEFCQRWHKSLGKIVVAKIARYASELAQLQQRVQTLDPSADKQPFLQKAETMQGRGYLILEELASYRQCIYYYQSPASKTLQSAVDRRCSCLWKQFERLDDCFTALSRPGSLRLPRLQPIPPRTPASVSDSTVSCAQQVQYVCMADASLITLRRPGDCYVVKEAQQYKVCYLNAQLQPSILHFELRQDCLYTGQQRFESLYTLLEAHIKDYCLLQSPEDPGVLATAFRQLYPRLLQRNRSWAATVQVGSEGIRHLVWMHRSGDVFISGEKEVGSGGFKTISRMQKVFGDCISQPLVAGLFKRDGWESSSDILQKLQADFGHDPRFLIPAQTALRVLNQPKKRLKRHAQVMPEMAGDLYRMWKDLSKLGRLRALKQVAEILHSMHERHWYYGDCKSDNVLIAKPFDPNWPRLRLADFDLAERIEGRREIWATSRPYSDPLIDRDQAQGWRAARKADQFAFATMLTHLMTGHYPKRSRTEEIVGGELHFWHLTSLPNWDTLDPGIRCVTMGCLVGLKERHYQMRDYITVLNSAILRESCH